MFPQSALGHCPEKRFTEAICTEKMEQLRKDLKALKGEIEARYTYLKLPYDHFNPNHIDNPL